MKIAIAIVLSALLNFALPANATLIGEVQTYRMCTLLCPNGFDESATYDRVNEIWAQADIEFRFSPIIDVDVSSALPAPPADAAQLINALAVVTGNNDSILSLGVSALLSERFIVTAIAQLGGIYSVVDPTNLPTPSLLGFAIANSLGHNLGLSFVPNDERNLMGFPTDFRTGNLTVGQIAIARQSRLLQAIGIPEPAILGLLTLGLLSFARVKKTKIV